MDETGHARGGAAAHDARPRYDLKFPQPLPFLLNLRDAQYRYYRHEKQCGVLTEGAIVRCRTPLLDRDDDNKASIAVAAGPHDRGGMVPAEPAGTAYQPFGPVDYVPDFQLFAPINDYLLEENPQPNEGYFFSYERMHWSVQKPDRGRWERTWAA